MKPRFVGGTMAALSRRLSVALLWAASGLMLFGANRVGAQPPDVNAKPIYGSVALKTNFLPDPFIKALVAGGDNRMTVGGAEAFIPKAPSFQLNYAKGTLPLTIHVESIEETMLLINLPNGKFTAVGKGGSSLNPMIRFDQPLQGRYDIFVGTFTRGATPAATLFITEFKVQQTAIKKNFLPKKETGPQDAKELLAENQRLREQVAQLTAQMTTKTGSQTTLVAENQKLRTEIAQLTAQLQQAGKGSLQAGLVGENQKLRAEIAQLTTQLQQAGKGAPQGDLARENQQLRDQLAQITGLLERSVDDLQKRLDDAKRLAGKGSPTPPVTGGGVAWNPANPPSPGNGVSMSAYLDFVEKNRIVTEPFGDWKKKLVKMPFAAFNPSVPDQFKNVVLDVTVFKFRRWRMVGNPVYTPFQTTLTRWKASSITTTESAELSASITASLKVSAGFPGLFDVSSELEAEVNTAMSYEKSISDSKRSAITIVTEGDTWNVDWVRETVTIIRPSSFGLPKGAESYAIPREYAFPNNPPTQAQKSFGAASAPLERKYTANSKLVFQGRIPPRMGEFQSYEEFVRWVDRTPSKSVEENPVSYKAAMQTAQLGLPSEFIIFVAGTPMAEVTISTKKRWRLVKNEARDSGTTIANSVSSSTSVTETATLGGRIRAAASVEAGGVEASLAAEIAASSTYSRGLESSNGVDREYKIPEQSYIATWVLERVVTIRLDSKLVAPVGVVGREYNGPTTFTSAILLGRFDDVMAQ